MVGIRFGLNRLPAKEFVITKEKYKERGNGKKTALVRQPFGKEGVIVCSMGTEAVL